MTVMFMEHTTFFLKDVFYYTSGSFLFCTLCSESVNCWWHS